MIMGSDRCYFFFFSIGTSDDFDLTPMLILTTQDACHGLTSTNSISTQISDLVPLPKIMGLIPAETHYFLDHLRLEHRVSLAHDTLEFRLDHKGVDHRFNLLLF